MAKPMPADALVLAQAASFLPPNIARRLVEFLEDGCSGQFILQVRDGRIAGAHVTDIVKVLDSESRSG